MDYVYLKGAVQWKNWQINETTDKLEHVATDGTVTTTELTIGSLVAYNEGTSGSYVADATKGIGTSREVTFDANDMVQFNLIGGTFTTTGANGTVAAGDLSWKVFPIVFCSIISSETVSISNP